MEAQMTAVFAHHGDRLLYRVGEAAQLLGISRSKAWELLARGDIESVKIDGARRITRDAIEAYVARLAGGSAA
jgi:excisionase family DNA binding protein